MKDISYYTTMTTTYPDRKNHQTTYYYKAGVCVGSSKDRITPTSYTVKETVLDEDSFKEQQKEHYAEKSKLHNEFKQDLFEELGITNHPKRKKLFELAWEHSGSDGYYQVKLTAGDFVELIN